jgi:hypothetical protein
LPAANKSAVIVSFKAQPKTILSGQDDTALSHFFDTAPTGNPIYWSYYHEPEGNIADGEFTLADYKAAWAHVVSLASAAHNRDLHSTLILGGMTSARLRTGDGRTTCLAGASSARLAGTPTPRAAPRIRTR